IVARMPAAIMQLVSLTNLTGNPDPIKIMTPGKIVFLIGSFVFVVAGSILITQAQRRIPIQQAKHTRGRRVYGGSKQYLPLRVNHGGVMPSIFAQSLMLFPGVFFSQLAKWFPNVQVIAFLNDEFARGSFIYVLTEMAMI